MIDKSGDRRIIDDGDIISLNPFVLTCSPFSIGQADKFVDKQDNEEKKIMGTAELLYYRGFPRKAQSICRKLDDSEEIAIRLGGTLVDALSAMACGNVTQILDLYASIKELYPLIKDIPVLKKTVEFFLLYFNVMLHNTDDIVFPAVSVDAYAVPDELKPMAIFTYSHYLIIEGEYKRAIGLSESALVFIDNSYVISRIYLSLITSIGYISCGLWERAEYFFRYAWQIAYPDKLIMPFAEYRWLLSGMLEKCMKNDYPHEFKMINELSVKYHVNWSYVHNTITGDTVSDKLTAKEFNVAMLASKNLSNTEIADFLDISVNSVRAHLRNIFNKLGIQSRKELSRFIIK